MRIKKLPRKPKTARATPANARYQIPTHRITTREIAAHPAFWQGVIDALQGVPFSQDHDDGHWFYDRGRTYAACCRAEGRKPLRQYDGKKLNEHLVRDLAAFFADGSIL